MNKILVVIFDSEKAAEAGTRALKELHNEGEITLYAMGVIAKDANGKVSVKEAHDSGLTGTGLGFAVGGLIGLLGGPVGLVVGAAAGTAAGALSDLWAAGVGLDFADEAAELLQPNRVAIVAEIDEEWITPVDSAMETAGGVVLRRGRAELSQAQFNADVSSIKSEISHLNTEIKTSDARNLAKLKSKLEVAEKRLDKMRQNAKAKVATLKTEADTKIASLKKQMTTAKDNAKAKLQERETHIKSVYDKDRAKLGQAWADTKDALSF
jgi:uncharacterized membrane protein